MITRWRTKHSHRVAFCVAAFLANLAAFLGTPAAGADWRRLATQLLQPVAVESQLPNSSTPMALITDAQGFLWVGTQNGLARWDGVQFRIFNSGTRSDSLPDSQIEALHVDHQGRLWVGTLSAGLAVYSPRTGAFTRYTVGADGHSYSGVYAIADAPEGQLWIGAEGGLDELAPKTGRVHHVQAHGAEQTALSSGVNVLATSADTVWIGSNAGLLRRDSKTGAVSRVHLPAKTEPVVKALLLDSAGRLWVGTDGAGAFVVDPATNAVRPVPSSMRKGLLGAGMRVRALLQISKEEVWLGTYDDGIIAVDPATLDSHRAHLGNGNLLYGDQNIRALHRAPDGQVFIAANSAITRYDPRHPAFETLMGGESPTAVLAERTPVFIAEDQRRRVWTGFISHGVDIVDPRAGKIIHMAPKLQGLPEAPVRALVPMAGSMLVATDSGLYRTDLDGRRVERLAQPGRAPDAGVMAMVRDGQRLWIAGRVGLWAYHLGIGDRLSTDTAVPAGKLSDPRVGVLALDDRGELWIGTSRGLNVFDPKAGTMQALEPSRGDDATPSGFISGITIDRRGRLWVATFGRGLSVADSLVAAKAHRFRRIDLKDGLPNTNVNAILEDAKGVIWASTDSGLARIDPVSLRVRALQLPQGVAVSSFFYNAALVAAPDDLLFAGRGGLQIVHPSLYRPPHSIPPLRITEVRQHGQLMAGDPFAALAPGAPLRLPPGGGGLEVSFAALDYGAPDRIRYAYRLRGSGSTGVEVETDQRTAPFSNLAPGPYTLEIRALDPSGDWPAQTLRLPVYVTPAWNQTWWFRLSEVMGVALAVLLLVWWRTLHLHQRRRELESLVDERTFALQEQKDVLEAQAVQLAEARLRAETSSKAKSDFLANMSHEIRTPLNGVVAVADMLAKSNLPAKEKGMAEIIRASGDTLQRLLSDILDMARIESGKITIETASFHAGDMLRTVAGLSELKCSEKGVRLKLDISADIDEMVVGDMVRVRQVVTNLLSNAVKFTDAGEVRLLAERVADGRARFTVIDTGVGFAMADKGKVLGRFEQADSSITRRFGGTGLGLSICCDLARLMGGSVDCDSEPGVGSRFWIELPLEGCRGEASLIAELDTTANGASGAPLRVLVADDHPTNRQVLQLMLDGMADLTCVEDGAQAVEAYRTGSFELVLMDMQMPVMDGLTALHEIRRYEEQMALARTPAIMLTANALPEHVASAAAAGADLHLSKPFTTAGLFEAIEEALSADERHAFAA